MKSNHYSKRISFIIRHLYKVLFITSTIIYFGILGSSKNVEFFEFQFDENGWVNFITVFQIPLGLLGLLIPIYGILLALQRMYQTEEQLSLQKHNINMNNYYRHMDEYLRTLTSFLKGYGRSFEFETGQITELINNMDENFFRVLYQILYGKKYESVHRILPSIKVRLESFLESYYLFLKDQTNDLSDKLFNFACEYGFQDILIKYDSNLDFEIEIGIVVDIYIRSLEFSDESPEIVNRIFQYRNKNN